MTTDPGEPHARLGTDDAFPFPRFRDHQQEALEKASRALWDDGYHTVVMDLPTGVGKSPINIALARQAKDAFYTTPQKKLRRQLEDDEVLNQYHVPLRARSDYVCQEFPAAGDGSRLNCDECPINEDHSQRCYEQDECTYWSAKEDAMDAHIAVLTFAFLRIDGGHRPHIEVDGEQMQVSFENRELLIVDEAHQLAEQMASMWAGFVLGPYTLPENTYEDAVRAGGHLEKLRKGARGDIDLWRFEQLGTFFNDVEKELQIYTDRLKQEMPSEEEIAAADRPGDDKAANSLRNEYATKMSAIGECETVLDHIEIARDDMATGRPWVINVDTARSTDGDIVPKVEVKPVYVDRLLRKMIWSRSDKRVLSSATIPYPDDRNRWMDELGIDPEGVKYISYPMPFPVENRPVYLKQLDKMWGDGFEDNIARIVDAIRWLNDRYEGEKGLVHTVSFDRAEALHRRLDDIAVLHDRDQRARDQDMDDQAFIDAWQQSEKSVFLSPSCMEGVDLRNDMCRWQVLPKVPYPNLGDSRVRYLLKEDGNEAWYNGQTATQIIQSVGRGVREPGDYCDYYVLDECYDVVKQNASFPEWFTDAEK